MNRLLPFLSFLALFATIFLFCSAAYAQGTPLPAAPQISTGAMVMLSLSTLLGIATQVQQSGKLFGQFTIPTAAIVVVNMVVPFLGGLVQYLSTVAFSGAAVTFGLFAGVANLLVGSAAGLAVHAHITIPARMASMRSSKAAATSMLLGALTMALFACTPAQLAAWDTAIKSGGTIAVQASNFACTVATEVDPSGATAICQEIGSGGALLGPVLTVVEDAPSVLNLVAKTSLSMQTLVHANLAVKLAAEKVGH
jgi:hypothetical protein